MTDMPPLPAISEVPMPYGAVLKALDEYAIAYAKAYADAEVEREREKWVKGARISVPTHAMEQEVAFHVRRAVALERARCAKMCESFGGNGTGYIDDDWAAMCAAAIRKEE